MYIWFAHWWFTHHFCLVGAGICFETTYRVRCTALPVAYFLTARPHPHQRSARSFRQKPRQRVWLAFIAWHQLSPGKTQDAGSLRCLCPMGLHPALLMGFPAFCPGFNTVLLRSYPSTCHAPTLLGNWLVSEPHHCLLVLFSAMLFCSSTWDMSLKGGNFYQATGILLRWWAMPTMNILSCHHLLWNVPSRKRITRRKKKDGPTLFFSL